MSGPWNTDADDLGSLQSGLLILPSRENLMFQGRRKNHYFIAKKLGSERHSNLCRMTQI